jgi:hypothetical protein
MLKCHSEEKLSAAKAFIGGLQNAVTTRVLDNQDEEAVK